MKIEISGAKIGANKAEKINKGSTVSAWTNKINGNISNQMMINIGNDDDEFVYMELNKNQALFLMNFLSSFINEKDIDPDDDED